MNNNTKRNTYTKLNEKKNGEYVIPWEIGVDRFVPLIWMDV
jgi:hypothetical protein